MGVPEDNRIEQLYREIRTLTAMRLKAVSAADWPWAEVLTATRTARCAALSQVCTAVQTGRPGHLRRVA